MLVKVRTIQESTFLVSVSVLPERENEVLERLDGVAGLESISDVEDELTQMGVDFDRGPEEKDCRVEFWNCPE